MFLVLALSLASAQIYMPLDPKFTYHSQYSLPSDEEFLIQNYTDSVSTYYHSKLSVKGSKTHLNIGFAFYSSVKNK